LEISYKSDSNNPTDHAAGTTIAPIIPDTGAVCVLPATAKQTLTWQNPTTKTGEQGFDAKPSYLKTGEVAHGRASTGRTSCISNHHIN